MSDQPSDDEVQRHLRRVAWFWISVCIAVVVGAVAWWLLGGADWYHEQVGGSGADAVLTGLPLG
ncbi:MAG: hypothetical protein U0W40_20285 [Acidimicrobiia bacterium]